MDPRIIYYVKVFNSKGKEDGKEKRTGKKGGRERTNGGGKDGLTGGEGR